jgi:MarR family transcriptional regulator, negative regulator of the multidrug operon emrRAB
MLSTTTGTQGRAANLLGALATQVSDRLERQLKKHPNQTDSAAAALNIIAGAEGLSNAALSQALQLSHPATVRLVAKLKDEGLVQVGDAKDGRAVALAITANGKQRVAALLDERAVLLRDLIGALSVVEQQQLELLLEKMLPNLVSTPCLGHYICRLCDHLECPSARCPVNLKCEYLSRERGPGE